MQQQPQQFQVPYELESEVKIENNKVFEVTRVVVTSAKTGESIVYDEREELVYIEVLGENPPRRPITPEEYESKQEDLKTKLIQDQAGQVKAIDDRIKAIKEASAETPTREVNK